MTCEDECGHIRCLSYRIIGEEQEHQPKVSRAMDSKTEREEQHGELPQEINTPQIQLTKCVPSGNNNSKSVTRDVCTLYCNVLYCTFLYYTVLYCATLRYTTLHYTIISGTTARIIDYTIQNYTILYYTTIHYATLHCTMLYDTTVCSIKTEP
jgi:hypothetical protein